MISEDGAMGLISPPGGVGSHLALQVAGRTAVPVISLCADSSVTQTGVPWMTRVVPCTIDEGRFLFTRASSHRLSATNRWAVVVPAGRAGREIAKDLRTAAKETDCSLHRVITLTDSPATGEGVPQQLLAGGTTAVLVWLDPIPAARIVKALRAAGFKGTLAGPSPLCCEAFMTAAADSLQGFLVPAIAREQESGVLFANFATSYRSRFGHAPGSMALYSYDAAALLIELLRRFGDESLRRGAPPDFQLPGASGLMRFDAVGNRKITLQLLTADQGHFTPLPDRKAVIQEPDRVAGMDAGRIEGAPPIHVDVTRSGKDAHE